MIKFYVSDEIASLLNRLVEEEATRLKNIHTDIREEDRQTWPESLKKLNRARLAIKEARTWSRNRAKN